MLRARFHGLSFLAAAAALSCQSADATSDSHAAAGGGGAVGGAGSLVGGSPGGAGAATGGTGGGPNAEVGTDAGAMPVLKPELLVATYLGGSADQFITEVGFDDAGNIFGKSDAFTLTYDATLNGKVTGDVSVAMDTKTFPVNYPLPKGGLSTNTLADPRNGQTYTWGTHPNVASKGVLCPDNCTGLCTAGVEVTPLLQMAFVTSSAGWKLWNYDWKSCVTACAVADSRGYDLWLNADGKLGVMLWTDGGDTPLLQDPKDVSKKGTFYDGSFGESPGGRGVLFAVIDPAAGDVPSGTWLNTHAVFHTHDDWGRVYITKAIPIRYGHSDTPDPSNPFAMSDQATTGLYVLRPDMKQPEVNVYLGGDPATCADPMNGLQLFDAVALRGNLLVMAGTTCVSDLKTTANAVQKTPGGGQDGFFVVLKLW